MLIPIAIGTVEASAVQRLVLVLMNIFARDCKKVVTVEAQYFVSLSAFSPPRLI
jgi:hypothetical protein